MRTTLNISDEVIKEVESIYSIKNRSKAVEEALKDAVRFKKIARLKSLKGKIEFEIDSENLEELRSLDNERFGR